MKLSTTVLIELLVVFVDCIDPEILNTNIFSTTVTTPTTSTIRTSTWPTATTETSPTTSWITSSSPLPSTTTTTTSTTPPTTMSSTTTSTTRPTTTSSTTTSTTRPPTTSSTTTSTTPSPTPTPKPPIPEKGIWMVNHTDNSTCIYLEMATSIEFYYINIRNEIDKGQINIPVQARVVGSCGEGDRHRQTIKLLWNFNSLLANTLEFVFRRNSHMYELDKVILNVTLDSEDFPTVKDADKTLILINKNMHFLTPENRSYKCTKPHTLSLHQQRNNVDIGKMKIMHLHFQAFGNITNGHLAKAMDCKPHHPSRSLFILLGAVIILFVIISVTYMITRSRHPIYGYSIVDKDGNRCESERTKLWRQSEEIPRDLTNVQTITEKEINVKMPYNSVKFLMTKFGKN